MKWYRQIRRCLHEIKAHRISIYAAGASFFLVTSILPLLMVLLSALR